MGKRALQQQILRLPNILFETAVIFYTHIKEAHVKQIKYLIHHVFSSEIDDVTSAYGSFHPAATVRSKLWSSTLLSTFCGVSNARWDPLLSSSSPLPICMSPLLRECPGFKVSVFPNFGYLHSVDTTLVFEHNGAIGTVDCLQLALVPYLLQLHDFRMRNRKLCAENQKKPNLAKMQTLQGALYCFQILQQLSPVSTVKTQTVFQDCEIEFIRHEVFDEAYFITQRRKQLIHFNIYSLHASNGAFRRYNNFLCLTGWCLCYYSENTWNCIFASSSRACIDGTWKAGIFALLIQDLNVLFIRSLKRSMILPVSYHRCTLQVFLLD